MGKRSPRLQFTKEERAASELKKVIQKADIKADKLEKAEAKIPKKTVKRKERVVDAEGKVTTRSGGSGQFCFIGSSPGNPAV